MATKSHGRQNTILDIFRKKCLIEITKNIIPFEVIKEKDSEMDISTVESTLCGAPFTESCSSHLSRF